MGDNNNWFNKVGKVAPNSNPGSATPNYGLTYDLATMPDDSPDGFDAMAAALTAYAQSLVPFNGGAADGPAPHQTLWDRASGAAGFVGDQIAGGLGAVKYGVLAADQHMPGFTQLDETKSGEARHILDEGHSWGDLQALGKDAAATTAGEVSRAPGAKQLFWGLDKANEYASTAMVAGTLSEDSFSKFFKAGTWGDAHALTKDRHLNAGDAFMQMFYDKELLLDEDRFEQMRTHNTVFNVGSLAFNVVAAWKADPNVLLGKGIGASRDLAVGKLAKGTQPTIAGKMVGFDSARTQAVQRDILGAKSLDEAKTKAESYSGVADKLRAVHAVSLYDRSQILREAAMTQNFEQFSKNMAFKSSASGVTMAKVMQDVAADDGAWNLVFRSAIGDPMAIPELIARQSDLSDKISAIEMKTMPRLQRDLDRTEARYQKRLAEQGKPQDARIELTRFGDKWLDDELTSLKTEMDDASANLAEYSSHESWLQRALPGLDEDSGIVSDTAPNTIYNALDRVGSRRSMQTLGGKVRMWQHDDYSPVSWVFRAPTKPNLKRVGVVSLNDVDDGAHAIHNYLDQLDHLRGFKDQAFRDEALGSFAGATTDMQRKAIAESVQRRATLAIGEKHGLSPAVMDLLDRELKSRRGKVWGDLSDTRLYSPIPGKDGPGYVSYTDDAGNVHRIKMPVDPTQLSNYHSLVNLTDLDRTIRQHRDVLRDFDKDLASHAQATAAKANRRLREFGDFVGSSFNSYWKPMALISLRWPVRVVADESMRVMLLAGVLPHLAHAAEGSKNMLWNSGVVRPYEWWAGRKVKTGSLAEESLRGVRTGYDDYDYRSVVNPTAAVPADSLDLGKMDSKRYDRLNATASERNQYLRQVEAQQARLELYHGTGADLPPRLLPAKGIPADLGQMYGRGLYATDDPSIAHEYAIQSRDAGKIYRVHFTGRVFDLDQRPSTEDVTALRSMNEAGINRYLDRHAANEAADEANSFTWQGLFESLPERDSRIRGLITKHLQKTRAVEALRYQGGRLSGGGDHNSYVFLNPEKLKPLSHVRDVRADENFLDLTDAERGIPEAPRWAAQWDERLAQAEESSSRGFFFDPLQPGKTVNKGFAVSPYPARMATFAKKPTARELNYWVEKNSDVLAVPNTRTAVWLDRDTGRWHLDAVKVTKRREDAMLLASKAEAPEFYDIEDGFTRYLSEDFYGHFNSPFVKSETGPGVANAAAAADEAGAAVGNAARIGGPNRRKVGFGEQTWRTADGRVVKGERVFGPDEAHSNIYYSVVSSKGAIQNLFGGYTKGIGVDRASRAASDYKYFDPADPGTNIDEWAAAYADFVNNHVRYSPIGQRMLAGKSDAQIFDWLMGTAAGRKLRQRIPTRGQNPAQWVTDSREIFDHVFPSEKALLAAREGDLTPEQVLNTLPEDERPFIHGDSFKLGLGTSDTHRKVGKVVDGIMNYLAAMPTDALVRHPFAQTVYNREMRNYLSSVKAEDVTQNVLHAAEASSRAKAVREVRRTLYNIADEREGVHMLRFVSPFFQAQLEVLERWARISMEKPEAVARLAQLFIGSQTINTPLWQVTDQEGKPVDGYHAENVVHFQVTPMMRQVAKKLLPGDPLKYADEVTIGASSLNLITAGEKPYMPSLGPLVTLPASEFYYKDRPELEDKFVYQWMFPFGVPKGRTFSGRVADAMLPAWAKRLKTAESADFDDSAFARRVSEIGAQMQLEWEQGGREGPRPTGEQALDAAKNEYRLRAASSFFLPVPLTPRSPYQFFIDQYRMFQEKYGADAQEKFYDEYGPTYFMFAQQATQSAGMGPNVGEKQAYDKYKKLAQQAPDMLGVLTGPFATDEFSDAVYQWQLATRVSPDSDTRLREHLDPSERISSMEIARGWVEYTKLSSALDAELRNRVAQGGSPYLTASSNADLAAIKSSKWREIVDRNPSWQDAYNSRQSHMGDWLGQAYQVAFDPSLDDRTDIQGLRTYLISRARLQDALRQREDAGLSSSDQLSFDPMGNPIGDNADLGFAWMSYINELKGQNPLFGEIYTRYLEGDDLSTYISPEVSGAH